jgi:hypothetical protein
MLRSSRSLIQEQRDLVELLLRIAGEISLLAEMSRNVRFTANRDRSLRAQGRNPSLAIGAQFCISESHGAPCARAETAVRRGWLRAGSS